MSAAVAACQGPGKPQAEREQGAQTGQKPDQALPHGKFRPSRVQPNAPGPHAQRLALAAPADMEIGECQHHKVELKQRVAAVYRPAGADHHDGRADHPDRHDDQPVVQHCAQASGQRACRACIIGFGQRHRDYVPLRPRAIVPVFGRRGSRRCRFAVAAGSMPQKIPPGRALTGRVQRGCSCRPRLGRFER